MNREEKILDIVRQTAHYLDKTGVSAQKITVIAPFLRELNYKTNYYISVYQTLTSFGIEVQEYTRGNRQSNYNTIDCWTWPVVS
jgi:hypothetical protein